MTPRDWITSVARHCRHCGAVLRVAGYSAPGGVFVVLTRCGHCDGRP